MRSISLIRALITLQRAVPEWKHEELLRVFYDLSTFLKFQRKYLSKRGNGPKGLNTLLEGAANQLDGKARKELLLIQIEDVLDRSH